MSNITFEAACTRYNEKPDSKSALATLRQEAGGARVFRMTEDGKINVAETAQAFAFLRTFPTASIPDAKTLDEVLTAHAPKVTAEACAVTGAAILFGKTATDPPIVYDGIDTATRLVIATAADAGLISGVAAAADLTFQIGQTKALPLERRWAEAKAKWQALSAKEHRTDEEEVVYRRIRARLVYAPERDTTQFPGSREMLPRPRPGFGGSSVTVGGSVSSSVIMTGNNNHVATSAVQPPLITIIASGEQGNAARQTLVKHLAVGARSGRYRIWAGVPSGGNVREHTRQATSEAALIISLVNTDLINDVMMLDLVAEQKRAGKRIIPVHLTVMGPYQLEDTPFAGLVSVPREGCIANHSDKDTAWSRVATEVRVAIDRLTGSSAGT